MKAVLFLALYTKGLICWLLTVFWVERPDGVVAEAVLEFEDVERSPGIKHGVVAFVVDPDAAFQDYVWGPMGKSMWITYYGKFLYHTDDWGNVEEYMFKDNPILEDIRRKYPDKVIRLAGVRRIFGKHIWPLNNPKKFILPIEK